jgi:hypothetical protein
VLLHDCPSPDEHATRAAERKMAVPRRSLEKEVTHGWIAVGVP